MLDLIEHRPRSLVRFDRAQRRRVVAIPSIEPPHVIEVEYRMSLWPLVRAVHDEIKTSVLPAYEEAWASRQDGLDRVDQTDPKIRVAISKLFARSRAAMPDSKIRAEATQAGNATDKRHKGTFYRGVSRKVGLNVSAAEPWRDKAIKDWVAQNTTLIKSVRDTVATGVQRDIVEALSKGTRPEVLRDRWIKTGIPVEFGTLEGRMRVIARDQVGKLNGQLSEQRQRGLGVKRYTWRTNIDGRERPHHHARNGQVFPWDSPPSDGHPGIPVSCRCSPEAILDIDEMLGMDGVSAVDDQGVDLAEETRVLRAAKKRPARKPKPAPTPEAEAQRLRAESLRQAEEESRRVAAEIAAREAAEAEVRRLAQAEAEATRLAAEERARVEAQRLAAERIEAERRAAEEARQAELARMEAERVAAEQAEAERLRIETEAAERERAAAEERSRAEAERRAAEVARVEAARVEVERVAREEAARVQAEAARAEAERQRLVREAAERERLAAEERARAEEAERARIAEEARVAAQRDAERRAREAAGRQRLAEERQREQQRRLAEAERQRAEEARRAAEAARAKAEAESRASKEAAARAQAEEKARKEAERKAAAEAKRRESEEKKAAAARAKAEAAAAKTRAATEDRKWLYKAKPTYTNPQAKQLATELFGKDANAALTNLLGLDPSRYTSQGIEVNSIGFGDDAALEVFASMRGGGQIRRSIRRSKDGGLLLSNDIFEKGEIKEDGLGAKMLLHQARSAQAFGIRSISTDAAGYGKAYARDAGRREDSFNGYYTWPRLGYDGKIGKDARERYRDRLTQILGKDPNDATISELISTKEGREFWKQHGTREYLHFDPTHGSRSMRALEAYVDEKSAQQAVVKIPAVTPKSWERIAPFEQRMVSRMSQADRQVYGEAVRREANLAADRVVPKGKAVRGNNPEDIISAATTFADGLSDEERAAIKKWSGDGFTMMRAANSGVNVTDSLDDVKFSRSKPEAFPELYAKARKDLALLRGAMERAPRHEGEIYRGVFFAESGLFHSAEGRDLYKRLTTVGETYTQESLASWSTSDQVANTFAKMDAPGSLVMRVKKSTRAMPIAASSIAEFGAEAGMEVLVDKGHRYRVVAVTPAPGKKHRLIVDLEQID